MWNVQPLSSMAFVVFRLEENTAAHNIGILDKDILISVLKTHTIVLSTKVYTSGFKKEKTRLFVVIFSIHSSTKE